MAQRLKAATRECKRLRSALCRTSSGAVIAAAMLSFATSAQAQLAANRGATGAATVTPRATIVQQRSQAATDGLQRQVAAQTRAQQIRDYATQARAAATRTVAEGLQGLVVARGIDAASLASGALLAARDATGRMTWQGAELPVEAVSGSSSLVTIQQTDSRAILSWDRFDVGANTTLQFNQTLAGIAQRDWVAVNRVVDPNAAPSQILGQIKADGTVVVINRNGMIFGSGAKVSANSLLASSLDIGNFLKPVAKYIDASGTSRGPGMLANTLQERNVDFLQNGLIQSGAVQGSLALSGMLTSSLTTGFYAQGSSIEPAFDAAIEGTVAVERGASITAGKGGFVILTGPDVSNHGTLRAEEGQVSLQAGRAISASPSTGAANRIGEDLFIRGLILRSPFLSAGSSVLNSGLIETPRGYASLGASIDGSVTNAGLIAATTSVSRNGTISLTAGTVTLQGSADGAQAGGLVIAADTNGETVPQGTGGFGDNFRSSQIRLGAIYLDPLSGASDPLGELGPAAITLGNNSLILAPNADVAIGGAAGQVFAASRYLGTNVRGAQAALANSRVTIGSNALIDVAGLKDVVIEAARNSLLIDPLKRNELRDTPNYRETNTNGDFTLNGATVYVDPRITGVRSDGVAYVGSPLIEAGSAASQIPVSAAELMTRGGSVSLNVALVEGPSTLAQAPSVMFASDATIDFSGGWVRYLDGIVRTSRLLTATGRVVDIGYADPNESYVAVGDGYTAVQAKYGVSRTYASSILQGAHFEAGYDEGRDAGALQVSASTLTLDGNLWGNAFAGLHQIGDADRPSALSNRFGDLRKLQARPGQLPSGGLLRIGNYGQNTNSVLAGDIVIAAAATTAPVGAIVLNDVRLGAAGLSGLSLATSGSIDLRADAALDLANGGALSLTAGRAITLDGTVSAASGSISARTLTSVNAETGQALATIGSPFRSDDEIPNLFASIIDLHPFDITVNGTLSTAGLWVNDLTGTSYGGSAFANGGSITLDVASNAFFALGGTSFNPERALDLSGSIVIAPNALLDVASGGYLGFDRTFKLDAKGGNVALINRTHYASFALTDDSTESNSRADEALGGINQTVQFTPFAAGQIVVTPSLVPVNRQAQVSFQASSLKGFGFGGGGTFTLVAPDIAMGSDTTGAGPRIDLDFLQRTGFGTLALSAYKSRVIDGLFSNGRTGSSAFLEISRFTVGAGQVFDLTQTVLPSLLDNTTLNQLAALESGGDLTSILTPGIPAAEWDRQAAHLALGGLTELDIAAGGTVTGAAQASLTVPRLYNAGTIRLAGGSIEQFDPFQAILRQRRVIGVLDGALGGAGLSGVLGGGTVGQSSGFDENALLNAAVFRDAAQTQRLTNGQLFSLGGLDALMIFTGRSALNEGVHLSAEGVIDLSGTAIYNPRAGFLANGTQIRDGRLIDGGTLRTSRLGQQQAASGYSSAINPGNQLVAEVGATIALDGASAVFDERIARSAFGAVNQWSDGGSLIVGGGAQLDGVNLSAGGGDDGDADLTSTKATGGVLDWVAPVLRQDFAGIDASGATLSADQLMAAGFDSLVVRDRMTTVGTVDLSLRKSFIATTATTDGQLTGQGLVIGTAAGSEATIRAPYIRFASSNRKIGGITPGNAGTLAFAGRAIDIAGSVLFNVAGPVGGPFGSVTLSASGDLRLIGAAGLPDSSTGLLAPGITGQLVSTGDLSLAAAQVYATTGTGNLQQLLEDRRAGREPTPSPYVIASTHGDGTVSFARTTGELPATPLSAGSYLAVRGAHIAQDGVLRAPMGLLDIGSNSATVLGGIATAPATQTLTLGSNSLTSVSARTGLSADESVSVPYGTTTDLIEYFFSPGTNQVLSSTPVGELRLAGGDITISSANAADVRVDGRGGGDVFAFEFIPGTGGSRDVLDRFNPDTFSGNNGLQFADGRQVYALVPASSPGAALYDPIYSADYAGGGGVDLYGADLGKSVWLDAAPGVTAGQYVLMPAHYALLPGALRLVENVGAEVPFAGGAATLLDGSVIVGGRFGTSGTDLVESTRRSFTVQSRNVFSQYTRIETTSGSATVEALAQKNNLAVPRLARDAARVVLAPLTSLRVAGAFATTPASGGLGSQVDIGGARIRIAAPGAVAAAATANYVLLTTDTLANFNANSLAIGALRNNNTDGTTTLDVTASQILVDNNVTLTAPELLLAVGGVGSALRIADAPRGGTGAVLRATGTLDDNRTGDYIINATAPRDAAVGTFDQTGSGALIRLASGPERLVTRQGDFALRNTLLPSQLDIGAGASLLGAAITLDSSRTFAIDKTAHIGAAIAGTPFDLVVSGDSLRLGGFTFAREIEAQFGAARNLTYRTPDILNLTPGTYRYNNLRIDAAGIGLAQPIPASAQTSDVIIMADHLALGNSSNDLGGCKDTATRLCAAGSNLTLDARDITFRSGQFRTWGFDSGLSGNGVTLRAREGMYVTGSGAFSMVNFDESIEAQLNLITPFIVDRTDGDVRLGSYLRPDYTFASVGPISVTGTGLAATASQDNLAPGARIAFQTGDSARNYIDDITITDALLRATAGTVDLTSTGSITLAGTATLAVPGFVKQFDDGATRTTVSAGAGTISLIAATAGAVIDASTQSTLIVDNGIGAAGHLNISSAQGEINLRSLLNPGIAANTARGASLRFDSGQSAFGLADFVANYGRRFGGTIAIRSGVDDLSLLASQTLSAASVSLTADGGRVAIAGTIDTSGDDVRALAVTDPAYKAAQIDGGAISLFGQNGVVLSQTAALVSTTAGYAAVDTRQAHGGTVSIGIGTSNDPLAPSAIDIAQGATINVAALQTVPRRVAEIAIDPSTRIETTVYLQGAVDQGGTVAFRAPLLNGNIVNFANDGTITGASELSLEAYRRYDLDTLAARGTYSGISVRAAFPADFIILDAGATEAGKVNFLADTGVGTIPDFIRNFSVMASSGAALDGYRVRPGVELISANDVRFANGWNLGAGQIVNADGTAGYADALAAGLLRLSPLGAYASGPHAGQPRYEVVAGREAELFSRFVGMTYRVGGSVRGEAPVIALRTSRGIDIANSISDGFFAFHDLTNPDYLNYQLGGGARTYNPALRINCGAGDAAACDDSINFADAPTGIVAGSPATRVTIQIGAAQQGGESSPQFIDAPYNPLANSAAPGGSGDPFGVAELFTRLTDGSAVHSSDLRFVAGAQTQSANPLQIDLTQTGTLKVSGERSYTVTATRGTASLAGQFQLLLDLPGSSPEYFDLDELQALLAAGDNGQLAADFYTVVNWGTATTGAAGAARTAALSYAPFQQSARFLGTRANPSGVSARLADIVTFLRDSGFAQTFVDGVINRQPGYSQVANLLTPVARLQNATVTVGTVVRTGDGRIDLAAAGSIDLRRTPALVTRRDPSQVGAALAQVGGNAVYTAGVRVSSASLHGAILPQFAAYASNYIQGPTSGVELAPVFAENGGAVSLSAGVDVIGRRDVWGELFGQSGSAILGVDGSAVLEARGYAQSTANMGSGAATLGTNFGDQRWRYGLSNFDDVRAAIAPNFFTSGVAALSGGDVSITAGRDVTDLTVALDNSLATARVGDERTLVSLGSGNLDVAAGRYLAGGQFDIASGRASIVAGGDVTGAGTDPTAASFASDTRNLLRLRVSDATASITSRGSIAVGSLGSLYVAQDISGRLGSTFYSPLAGVSLSANGSVDLVQNRAEAYIRTGNGRPFGIVLPPTLNAASLFGDFSIGTGASFQATDVLYASRYGQLSILAGGNIADISLAMSDATPANNFGYVDPRGLFFPQATASSTDEALRALHDRHLTHLDDRLPVQIVAQGSISRLALAVPKLARVRADGDIVNLFFQGQNLLATDVTRISAGRDITGTIGVATGQLQGRSGVLGNTIVLGGPGTLYVEAGRNLGPFVTSATGKVSEAGGIRTVGNEHNPWLAPQGANIYALFGVANGADFDALQLTYLDPARLENLDGDLFLQQTDELGNKRPDRTKFTYATVLAQWLRDNAPDQFAAVFGASPPSGDALAAASYTRYADLYAAFAGLHQETRTRFLIDGLYFGELAAPTDPNGPSFNQFARGYRAVQTLFPANLGYTDNLSNYTIDPATISADHPLGVPTRKLVNGEPVAATQINTGNVDLRLSTIETSRGGNISLLGPGGNFVAGSVVRTSAQINRRVTPLSINSNADLTQGFDQRGLQDGNYLAPLYQITAIPAGYEGILTLRGGTIRTFTDGSFVLNQSRLFTQRGGDITMWSSNGDLNAGQGPRSASNFPPIVLRFNPNGYSEVDSAGSVSGAGIGAFKGQPDDPDGSIRLIAPVGTVDAGDAGVRASGSVFVAAARVANADSFSAGGTVSGVPSLAAAAPPPSPGSAASSVAANSLRANDSAQGGQRQSRVFVNVLGYLGGSDCPDGQLADSDGQCTVVR